jgi:ribonuclease BN (tRNA processing enzyme)
MPSVTVLGGSAASVSTGQGCSGLLVSGQATNLVLDLGPGTLIELLRHADFRRLDGVVLSHLHTDHILDVFALRFALAYNPVRPDRRTPLWLPPGGLTFFERAAALFATGEDPSTYFSDHFELAEYDPAQELTLGEFTLAFRPTVHYIPCWAMRVHPDDDSGDLGYTADTGPAAQLASFFQAAEVVVAEASTLEPTTEPESERGHMTASESARLARESGARTLVLVHIAEEGEPPRFRDAAGAEFDGDVVVGRPGTRFTW